MTKYVLEVSDKYGNKSYYRYQTNKSKYLEDMKVEYKDFQLTQDINQACVVNDEYGFQGILEIMKEYRPLWFKEYTFKVIRKRTLRDMAVINTRPLKTMTKLIKAYKLANGNIDAKLKIIEKLTSDELINACEYSLTELSKLK